MEFAVPDALDDLQVLSEYLRVNRNGVRMLRSRLVLANRYVGIYCEGIQFENGTNVTGQFHVTLLRQLGDMTWDNADAVWLRRLADGLVNRRRMVLNDNPVGTIEIRHEGQAAVHRILMAVDLASRSTASSGTCVRK